MTILSPCQEMVVLNLHRRLRSLNSPDTLDADPWIAPASVENLRRLHPDLGCDEVVRAVLDEALELLREHSPLLADLLFGRFWQRLTVAHMVHAQRPEPQSERRFYQQQKRALIHMAEILMTTNTQRERDTSAHLLLHSLPMPTYGRLFGVDQVAPRVVDLLAFPIQNQIITLKGVGGTGKTALADAVVRTIVEDGPPLAGLVWISAKQEFISTSGIVGMASQIGIEELFDEPAVKLQLDHVVRLPLTQKIERLADLLRSRPYLIVIDSLETITDFHRLVPWLERLAGPTKFLLTSRQGVPALATVSTVEIGELDERAATALIDHVAECNAVDGVNPGAVFALTGGNALAITLIVSQMKLLPPQQVLEGTRRGALSDLYTYVYGRSWSLLSDHARELLCTIQSAGGMVDAQRLALLYKGAEPDLFGALNSLLNLSLLQVHPKPDGQRTYSIHGLTSTFLGTELLAWK